MVDTKKKKFKNKKNFGSKKENMYFKDLKSPNTRRQTKTMYQLPYAERETLCCVSYIHSALLFQQHKKLYLFYFIFLFFFFYLYLYPTNATYPSGVLCKLRTRYIHNIFIIHSIAKHVSFLTKHQLKLRMCVCVGG